MSKNHPKICTKPPNGGYGNKQRDLASLKKWPRYWQKGRVKGRQNSRHVYPRLKGENELFVFLLTNNNTTLSPGFSVNISIIRSGLHFWRYRFNMAKFFLNLVNSSWLWWIMRVILTNQKRGYILNE